MLVILYYITSEALKPMFMSLANLFWNGRKQPTMVCQYDRPLWLSY